MYAVVLSSDEALRGYEMALKRNVTMVNFNIIQIFQSEKTQFGLIQRMF